MPLQEMRTPVALITPSREHFDGRDDSRSHFRESGNPAPRSDSLPLSFEIVIPMSFKPGPEEGGVVDRLQRRLRPAFVSLARQRRARKTQRFDGYRTSGRRAQRKLAPKPRTSPLERWVRAGAGR